MPNDHDQATATDHPTGEPMTASTNSDDPNGAHMTAGPPGNFDEPIPDTLRMTTPEDAARAALGGVVGSLGHDELRVLMRIAERLQVGRRLYGPLYLSTDDAAKDIFKVNLDTGTVIPLFALNENFEEEGLAFLARPDGSLLHTLNVFSKGLGSELRHHQRTRSPLRQAVCG